MVLPGQPDQTIQQMANWSEEKKVLWDEDRVVRAFCRWLWDEGWTTVETEQDYVDIAAKRGDERLYVEVKGKKKGRPGMSVDALYGQLLRRMPDEEIGEPETRFAVVVPREAATAARRVSKRVRDLLRIDIYTVGDDDEVELLTG
jgi:hypothetical protein